MKQRNEKRQLEGRFMKSMKGATFVRPEGALEDVYIPRNNASTAMDGDTVLIELLPPRRRRLPLGRKERQEARVIKVLKRAHTEIVGRVQRKRKTVFVIPDDPRLHEDIFIPKGSDCKAKNNEKVVVQIVRYPENGKSAVGKVIRMLGVADSRDGVFLSVLEQFGVPYEWGRGVERRAKQLPTHVTEKDRRGRTDYRRQPVITIDGDDTKDVDDGVFLQRRGTGWRLYVHIADVSHYVKAGDPIDGEALLRGTSVYLIDHVVPMLPKQLSNGICSLNEGVDRLCMTCIMDLDRYGNVTRAEVREGVINVKHHMTYKEVQGIIDGDGTLRKQYGDVVSMIEDMHALSAMIDRLRKQKGNVDFDTAESVFDLNEAGVPIDVRRYERQDSMRIIENFMIAANESVSSLYTEKKVPFLYRVHEEPDEEKMEQLTAILKGFGLHLPRKRKIVIGDLQRVMARVEGKDIEPFISNTVLHSMMRARYDVHPLGHFALNAKYYSHFTSPIRRYPDLQIHRIIKDVIHGRLKKARYTALLPKVAEQASKTQRRADECEREYTKIKQVEFMRRRIGQTFTGTVSHITHIGMYVALDNTVEGMVRIRDIDYDEFAMNEENDAIVGKRSGDRYRIGARVQVRVSDASPTMRTVDFKLLKGLCDEKADSQQ